MQSNMSTIYGIRLGVDGDLKGRGPMKDIFCKRSVLILS